MSIPRALSLTVLALVATTWAVAMVVSGLWLLGGGGASLPMPPSVRRMWALLLIACGQYVFVVVVANRLFPAVGSRPVIWYTLELPTIAFVGVLTLAVLALYAGVFH
jgi:hypothetical protein